MDSERKCEIKRLGMLKLAGPVFAVGSDFSAGWPRVLRGRGAPRTAAAQLDRPCGRGGSAGKVAGSHC